MGGIAGLFTRTFQMIKHMPTKVTRIIFCTALYLFSTDMWFITLEHYSIDAVTVKILSISVKIAVSLLLIFKFCTQRLAVGHVVIIATVLPLIAYSAVCSKNNGILWALFFIITVQDIEWRDIGCTQLAVLVSTILMDIVLAVTGIGSDVIRYTPRRGIRYSLGFTHPNTAALFVVLFLLAALLVTQKIAWMTVALPLVIAVFNDILFDARGSVLSLIALSVMLLVLCLKPKLSQVFEQVCGGLICAVTDLLAAASILGMIFYRPQNRFWSLTDWVYSGRLSLLHNYFQSGLKLFGRHYSNAAQTIYDGHGDKISFIADNLFANLLLQEGIILGSLLLILLLFVQWTIRHNFDIVFIGFSYFLLLGFSEASGLSISYNWFLLEVGLLLFTLWTTNRPHIINTSQDRMCSLMSGDRNEYHVPQHVRSWNRKGKHTVS